VNTTAPPRLVNGAVVWQSGVIIDADGANEAYRLDNQGLDDIKNAKCSDGSWCGAVTKNPRDKFSDPVVQGPNDPAPGFLVSPTSLFDPAFTLTDPRRYLDASTRPYFAICPELRARFHVDFGDLGVLLYDGNLVGMIGGDGCPHSHYGEVSIASAVGVGLSGSPRIGGADSGATFVIFPDSAKSPKWPRAVVEYQQAAMDRFDTWGGKAAVQQIFAA
jgi:hypothetical protein